jgi:hypothetical protein
MLTEVKMGEPKTLEKKPVMDVDTYLKFEQTLNDLQDAEERFVFLQERAVELISQGHTKLVNETFEAGAKAKSLYQAANKYDVPEQFQAEINRRQANIDSKLAELEKAKAEHVAYDVKRQQVRKMVKGY